METCDKYRDLVLDTINIIFDHFKDAEEVPGEISHLTRIVRSLETIMMNSINSEKEMSNIASFVFFKEGKVLTEKNNWPISVREK